MNHAEQPHCISAFIGLQMTDEVPFNIARASGDFQLCLLNFAFSEDAAAVIGQLAHGACTVVFRDRQQHNLRRVTTGEFTGGIDPFADDVQSLVQFHVAI